MPDEIETTNVQPRTMMFLQKKGIDFKMKNLGLEIDIKQI